MNTPKKTPNGKKWWARNSQVSSMILTILDTLKNKPQNQWKDNIQILKEFLEYYRIESDFWLLEEISKNWTVTFDMIKDDGFGIDQIIGDDRHTSAITLHNVLNSSSMWELWKDMEKVVINKLVERIKDKVPSNLKSSLDREMNNTKTLNEFKNQLWNFVDYGDGWKKIDEYLEKEIKDIRIENKDIVDGLMKDGKIWANDVDWNFKNWNTGVSKKFDKLITQEYLDGMKSSLAFLEKNFGLLKNTFNDFVPNMWWITKKYPWKQNEIDDEIRKKLDEAQENWNKEEFDKLSFYAYIDMVQKKNKNLWDLLSKLFQNKFDFGKLSKEDQNEFLRENISARLEELKVNNLSNLIWVDQSDFEYFAKNIFDLNQNEIVIDTAQWDIRLGVNKKLKGWVNPNFIDMSNFADAKIPLELDIKVLEENNDLLKNAAIKQVFANEISEDGKSINLNWDNIGKLFLLYVLAQNSFDNRSMNKDNVDKLKEVFDDKIPAAKLDPRGAAGQAAGMTDDKDKKGWEGESKESQDSEENKEKWIWLETKEKTEKQKFLESRDNIKWYQFPNSKWEIFDWKEIWKWFEIWTRIWIKTWFETELPPMDVWWDQWIQLKIINITNTNFTVELEWWELAAGNLEGKKIVYPKTKESLDKISNAFNGDIYKLPDPKNWDKAFGAFGDWNLGISWSGIFGEVRREKWKFMSNLLKDDKGNEEEITHRWMDSREYDDKWKEEIVPIYYKVSHNSDNTFTVELGNYKRKMDYNNFMIFVSTKNLKPSTQKNADDKVKNHDEAAWNKHKWRKEWKFFGIKQILEVFKWVGKKVDDALKNYSKERQDMFNEFLVSDVWIYKKMAGLMSFIPWAGDAFQTIELEYRNERDAKVWKKTEKRLKIFEADPDFGQSFDLDWFLRPYLWWLNLKEMIIDGKLPQDRYIAPATLLALIKNWSPYRGIQQLRLKWAWVKLLLWEEHQQRFLAHQQELIREIESKKGIYWSGYDWPMVNDLVRAEMTYLVNNIWGRATWQRFGQILWEDWWDDNPKRMRSDKFAWELDWKYNERISQSKIEDRFNWLKQVTNFTFCYNEFKRFSGSGRSQHALAFLKRMATLAKSPQQISLLKMCIIGSMLNGFFLHFADKDTKWWLESICRSMWFSPWLWITRYEQKEKIAYMLDYISNWEFWKNDKLKYNSNSFSEKSEEIEYKKFLWNFEKWRYTNWTNIESFLRKLPVMEDFNGKNISKDPIMNELKALSIENQVEWTDKDVNTNSKIITDSPLTQTKWFVQREMMKYDNGWFTWEVDQIQAAEDFRNSVSKQIPKWKLSSSEQFESIAKVFLNRFDRTFDENGKSDFVRRISTIKWYQSKLAWWKIKQEWWDLTKKDLDNIMRYSTVWEIVENERSSPPTQFKWALEWFYNLFLDNIDKFDNNFIESFFGKQYLEDFNRPYYLAPWNEYIKIVENFSSSFLTEEESELAEAAEIRKLSPEERKLRDEKKRDYRNEDIYLNKKLRDLEKRLSRKWLQWHTLWLSSKDIDRSKVRLWNI